VDVLAAGCLGICCGWNEDDKRFDAVDMKSEESIFHLSMEEKELKKQKSMRTLAKGRTSVILDVPSHFRMIMFTREITIACTPLNVPLGIFKMAFLKASEACSELVCVCQLGKYSLSSDAKPGAWPVLSRSNWRTQIRQAQAAEPPWFM
jgi:hypothetical protein